MKKTLCTRLTERMQTVEFRKIRKLLNVAAENKIQQYMIPVIGYDTINMLQNEGLTVEKIKHANGYENYKISGW